MCLHREGWRKFARDFYSGEPWSQFNWIIFKKKEAATMRTVFPNRKTFARLLVNQRFSILPALFHLTFYSSSPLRHRPPVRQHPNPEKKKKEDPIDNIFDIRINLKDVHSMLVSFPGYKRKERRQWIYNGIFTRCVYIVIKIHTHIYIYICSSRRIRESREILIIVLFVYNVTRARQVTRALTRVRCIFECARKEKRKKKKKKEAERCQPSTC